MRRSLQLTRGNLSGGVALLALIVAGCASTKQKGYQTLIRNLDGKSELEISTYPAFFGSTTRQIPLVYQKNESHGKVYFQLFVRDRKKKVGPNKHVNSILIREFSYKLDDLPRETLLTNYRDHFWMQGNPNYEKRNLPAVPYRPDSVVTVEVDLKLNGKNDSIRGEMPSSSKTIVYPLSMELLR